MVPPLVVGGAGALSALLVRGPLPAFPYVTNPLGVDGAVPDVLAAMGHHELWPAALIPPAAWLLVVARSEPSAGRRRVLRRVGVVAPLPSLGILVLTEAGAGEWAWVVTLLYALLLVDVTLFAARRERLWGMPALVHRTVLWVALSALAATASALVLYSEAQAGLQGPLQLAVGLGLAFGLASTAHAALAARLRRCLIGEGGDTLRALARLEDQLQHAEAGRPAPEVLAEAAASAVRGSVAVVDVLVSGRRRRVAGPDAPLEERLTLPIVTRGRPSDSSRSAWGTARCSACPSASSSRSSPRPLCPPSTPRACSSSSSSSTSSATRWPRWSASASRACSRTGS